MKEDAELLFEKNRITGVRAGSETIYADTVIVCAGAWANGLLNPLGVNFNVTFKKHRLSTMNYLVKIQIIGLSSCPLGPFIF